MISAYYQYVGWRTAHSEVGGGGPVLDFVLLRQPEGVLSLPDDTPEEIAIPCDYDDPRLEWERGRTERMLLCPPPRVRRAGMRRTRF